MLVDTNVVLDALLARPEHVGAAAEVFAASERGQIRAALCATTLTTVDYLVAKGRDRGTARSALRHLLKIFDVAAVTRAVVENAVESKAFGDFEDAVLHAAARSFGADVIVTRNVRDFRAAELPVYTPPELLAALGEMP